MSSTRTGLSLSLISTARSFSRRSVSRKAAGSDQNSAKSDGASEKTIGTSTPSPSVQKCLQATSSPRIMRFNVSIIMMCTIQTSMLLSHTVLSTHSFLFSFIAQIHVLFICAYMYEWTQVHSRGLTRHKRAYFDETNVLSTYQPRARTHGHLFIPDPPTPGPIVKFSDDTDEKDPSKSAEFNKNRDHHYANMFQYAMQMSKEMENLDKNACNDSTDPNAQLKPADPVQDKKTAAEDEKKKKAKLMKDGMMNI